jgi:two-component system, OmpR family, sensor kinase
LPIANKKDELGNLAFVFNDLLDRLNVEFDRQQRFMADASHELRTPLAIVCGESEVALSDGSRTPADYQESLLIVNEEGLRLTKIVEDLFTLARADSGPDWDFLSRSGSRKFTMPNLNSPDQMTTRIFSQ